MTVPRVFSNLLFVATIVVFSIIPAAIRIILNSPLRAEFTGKSKMISFSTVDSLLVACLVLLVGKLLTSRISFLGRYSIPDPVVGGLLFAIGAFVVTRFMGIDISMETDIRSVFLLIFFSCIGLTADIRLLKRGGPRLAVFLLSLVPFLVLQNVVGLGAGYAPAHGPAGRFDHAGGRPWNRRSLRGELC